MTKLKRISDWLQVLGLTILIFFTIPYTPLLWKPLSAVQKSHIISGIYVLAFLLEISILIYLVFYRRERRVLPYCWLITIGLLYLQALNSLKEFPVEKFHLIEYGALGILTFKALKNDIKDLSVYILSGLVILYIGIFDETIQWFTPNRVGAIEDVWLNAKSGILSLMLIGLVLRPREIEERFYLKNLRKVYIYISLALLTTGVFIHFVHDFGYRIRINDSIEIYSHFSKEELRSINDILGEDISQLKEVAHKFENISNSGKNKFIRAAKEIIFFKEAADHRWERENSFSKNKFSESLSEQVIIENCYSSVFYFDYFKWSKKKESLAKKFSQNNGEEKEIYKSPVCSILITEFLETQMWIFIGITTMIIILLYIKG